MGSSALLLILLMSFIHSELNQHAGDTVQYYMKPVVKVTPDQRVFRGETVTLTCDIQGGGNIQWAYSWFKDRNPLNPYTTTASEFSFTAEVSYSGEYSCRGVRSDSQTDISAAVTLTVSDLPTPTLTVTPDRSVFTGERVNLKCVINSDHTDWRYEWNKDSSMLQASERYTVNRDTLSIVEAVESDQGWYTCKGHIDGRSVSSQSSSVYLSVKDLPTSTLTVTPDISVFTGERVNLKCVIETYRSWIWRNYQINDWRDWTHEWRYEWYKGIRSSVKLQMSVRYTVNRDTLSIVGAVTSDQDQYWCRGLRDGRPNTSQSSSAVSLSVKDKPKPILTVRPQSSVFTGDTVTLSCDVGQSTGWTFLWRKGSDPEFTGHSTISVSSVRVSDGETYQCRAERGKYYTELSDTIKITVRGKCSFTL
ncbi:B-cell receptor CD22-like [Megalobrama amblycephala]|uniref:B-cell receptor CD22-like n=1 Tax=Megalobrama amblycephala TaxID=75352 RepID=UPI0020143128|nr:B-cell receptor CD22-like [Megalobrama amblycephala]